MCSKLLSLFVSLLVALVIKDSHIFARAYFIFLKTVLKQTLKSFDTKIDLSEKGGMVVTM